MTTQERQQRNNNYDHALVIGDVGIDVILEGKELLVCAGGTALNLAAALCDVFSVPTWLFTGTDPNNDWLTAAAMRRFNEVHPGLGSERRYKTPGSKWPEEVNPAHLAVVQNRDVNFSLYSGPDIDLTQPQFSSSIRESIESAVITAVDTRLTEDTLEQIARHCADMARPLIVLSGGREETEDRFTAVKSGGGCHLLVLGQKEYAMLGEKDPCEVAGARFAVWVRPSERSWSIQGPGRRQVAKGEVGFGEQEKMGDTIGALEGVTAGYIASVNFDGHALEDRRTSNTINEGLKKALMLTGGNRLVLRDPENPEQSTAPSQ